MSSEALAYSAAAIATAMLALWLLSLALRDASIVDIWWGPGIALDALGVVLFAIGLGFEAIGDAQLARFRASPANAGRVMDRGLWRYTRHPDYFGDALAHWGLSAIALATPLGWLAALSPALMTFLLLRVSGVALVERSIGKRRPEYAEYRRRTSAFIPLPPRA